MSESRFPLLVGWLPTVPYSILFWKFQKIGRYRYLRYGTYPMHHMPHLSSVHSVQLIINSCINSIHKYTSLVFSFKLLSDVALVIFCRHVQQAPVDLFIVPTCNTNRYGTEPYIIEISTFSFPPFYFCQHVGMRLPLLPFSNLVFSPNSLSWPV